MHLFMHVIDLSCHYVRQQRESDQREPDQQADKSGRSPQVTLTSPVLGTALVSDLVPEQIYVIEMGQSATGLLPSLGSPEILPPSLPSSPGLLSFPRHASPHTTLSPPSPACSPLSSPPSSPPPSAQILSPTLLSPTSASGVIVSRKEQKIRGLQHYTSLFVTSGQYALSRPASCTQLSCGDIFCHTWGEQAVDQLWVYNDNAWISVLEHYCHPLYPDHRLYKPSADTHWRWVHKKTIVTYRGRHQGTGE